MKNLRTARYHKATQSHKKINTLTAFLAGLSSRNRLALILRLADLLADVNRRESF
jgi:hypothetical protein